MENVKIWELVPFAVMLLGIAVLPLFAGRWWEKSRNQLLFVLLVSVPTAIYLCCTGLGEKLAESLFFDYLPFIILLCALFVVTGGIHIRSNVASTPLVNSLVLFAGFNVASFIGTTGAAMLLIRPLLDIIKNRRYKAHTIMFFIAMVANCGGMLTPLGDPPLFLLYLHGAPFGWFTTMFPEWATAGALLLAVYFIVDSYCYRKEHPEVKYILFNRHDEGTHEVVNISVAGVINVFYIIGIVTATAFINKSYIPAMGEADAPLYMKFLREIVLVAIIAMSLLTTRKRVRRLNDFSWGPIREVAVLFVGIFTTMTPALLYLNAHAGDMGLSEPWHFFYSTGALSSFLDNAPTAVAFHTVALGLPAAEGATLVAGVPQMLLRAISLGAVFFGAMTYIGNGPNFMVKAIAEQAGVKMPSFFGYIFKFSLIVLLPIYIIVQLIFF